jgi:hypothetical protein
MNCLQVSHDDDDDSDQRQHATPVEILGKFLVSLDKCLWVNKKKFQDVDPFFLVFSLSSFSHTF